MIPAEEAIGSPEEALFDRWADLWTPPPQYTLSQWAEEKFRLSGDYADTKGELTLYGWQRGIFDAFTDPRVSQIVLMCGTQLVKTLFIQCAIAYSIDQAPGPMLVAQPTDDDAETFSKERLAAMIRDVPALAVVAPAKGRDARNTTSHKSFPGGSLSIVGSNSPGNFARRTIRYFFADEVDKYKPTSEGDQLKLGKERLARFRGRSKAIFACSPTTEKRSRIAREYDKSDQRKPWVPCPSCGQFQILKFENVRWEPGDPRTAHYLCRWCEYKIFDRERWAACELADWRADAGFTGTAGFWISHLYSPVKTLAQIVATFLDSKDDRQAFQVFVNTNLAELWREDGEKASWEAIKAGSEAYPINENAVAPMRSSFLTAAVDFQREWLQVELKAWGRGRENWSLGMWRVEMRDGGANPMQTSDPSYRKWLQEFLAKSWPHESGARLPIIVMSLDTGEQPTPVYRFARTNASPAYTPQGAKIVAPRTVIPVKGASSGDQHLKLIVSISQESAARKRGGVRIVTFGSGFAKQEFYSDLRLKRNDDGSYPPGYCHFPRDYDDSVYMGYTAEERIVTGNTISWTKRFERNEPLDCHCMNRAAAGMFGIDLFGESHWRRLDEQMGINRQSKAEAPAITPTAVPPTGPGPGQGTTRQGLRRAVLPPPIRSNYANRYR